MRLDSYLASCGLARSRTHAKRLIEEGFVTINGAVADKCARETSGNEKIVVLPNDFARFVGRGGLKLDYALEYFGIDVTGAVAADIGAGTGGFTDCLIKRGAAKVYAIENGHGQLDKTLYEDSRVVSVENYNARLMKPSDFSENFGLAVMDVSFISQSLIYPALKSVLKPGAALVSLIKPQFEAGREYLSKAGIIKNPAVYPHVISALGEKAAKSGFSLCGTVRSPICGGDGSGNIEFLGLFRLMA